MSAALESLVELPGVTGLCWHRGAEILWARLPENVARERAVTLCAAVSSAVSSYAGAGRYLREMWLEFPGLGVLVIAPPGAPGDLLTFIVRDRSATGAISASIKLMSAES